MKTLLICFSIISLFLAGCTTVELERFSINKVSAQNISNNLKSSDITVTDIEAWALGKRWKATTPDGTVYNCSSDQDFRRVDCVIIAKAPTVRIESDQSIKKDIQVESDQTIKKDIQVESDQSIKKDLQVESDQTIKKDVQVGGYVDFYTELKKLNELKESGLITEDEYQTLKNKLIERY